MKPSYAAVRQAARDNIESLCARLLPTGRREGEWWRCRVPWRAGDGRNLAVSMTTGLWRDWARPGDEGSMLDLMMRLDNCDLSTARDRLASILGIGDVPDNWKPPKPPPAPKCGTCQHSYLRRIPPPETWCCNVTVVGIDEYAQAQPIRIARRPAWRCGPSGKLWRARADA